MFCKTKRTYWETVNGVDVECIHHGSGFMENLNTGEEFKTSAPFVGPFPKLRRTGYFVEMRYSFHRKDSWEDDYHI